MPRIIISGQAFRSRGNRFKDLLKPLLNSSLKGVPAWDRYPIDWRTIVLAASNEKRGVNYSEWFFPTFLKGYLGNYYEVWISDDPNKKPEKDIQWYLEKAYLQIYRGDLVYFCLHCDPEAEDGQGIKACYKRGPHLHIKTPYSLIPKAHIALAHGYVDKILASEGNLLDAMRLGVELLCDEILPRIEE